MVKHLVTIDFETFYDDETGFKKQTTEEYINDPRFHVIGAAVKIDDGEARWYTPPSLDRILDEIPWDESLVLCHNTLFDGAILTWKYNVKPAGWLDTLSMARAAHGVEAGGSLAALAQRYKIGEKGDEVINAKGKRLIDFKPDELDRYGKYCENDVRLTYDLFLKMAEKFSEDELKLIDLTVRMFTEPVFKLDDALLQNRLAQVYDDRNELLRGLMEKLKCENEEEVRKKLASNKQFAVVLDSLGVDPPMKTSLTTGKPTFALAKTDEGFLALQEHDDPFIQHLCAVRLGTKSTLEESRIKRFLDICARNKGHLPVPLKYYGAHTGRWAGLDKINLQNLPSRDVRKKALKNAIVAPAGHYIINSDSSQIEARILAWLAGQDDVVKQFADGEDVYSIFASKIYKRPISKADPVERFVGKTCVLGLGYGTGAAKLQRTLATAKPVNVELPIEECEEIVKLYRSENDAVPLLWSDGDRAIKDIHNGTKPYYFDKHHCVIIDKEGIRLPNNMYIRYPDTELENGKYFYKSRKGPVDLWGGVVVENVVQALARIVVGKQMLKIAERYKIAVTVHDSAVVIVRKEEIDEAMSYVIQCMSTPPEWGLDLPITCEAKYSERYGEC